MYIYIYIDHRCVILYVIYICGVCSVCVCICTPLKIFSAARSKGAGNLGLEGTPGACQQIHQDRRVVAVEDFWLVGHF